MKHFSKSAIVAVLVSIAVILTGACCVSAMDQVNINTASIDQLMALDRVGAKYAQRIIEYRELNGPFLTIEDIMKVKGIGKKIFEQNKNVISV